MTSGGSTYLPLRVNMAGVIPVIFAASIMAFPPTIGQLLNTPAALDFAAFFGPNRWAYVVGEVFFIIIFTYFYTAVTFNPVDQADNLKKYGGFIPGVRPGRPTAEYLDRILSRLTFPGALYLGAVAALPTILISQTSANFYFGGTSILIVIGVALAVIVAIVYVQEGQRRIPVQYAKRVVGRKMTSGGSTYLPLRVNMAGVIPVIFAASIMAFPPTIGQLFGGTGDNFWLDFAAFFNPNGWAYVAGEVFFIIVFTYFYTAVTFNPVDQADNLKKYGGFIPGVRPGRPTAEYLDRILSRLTFPGALYLGAVAALPTILISQTSANFFFGGTSILIVIGVALDTVKQLEAQLMMRNYEGFLK
jgi:preprotein translocase subunit SecY